MATRNKIEGIITSDIFKKAREARKSGKNEHHLTKSLNMSLNQSIQSFEKVYKNDKEDALSEMSSKANFVFEENSEASPTKAAIDRHPPSLEWNEERPKHKTKRSVHLVRPSLELSSPTSVYFNKRKHSGGIGTPKNHKDDKTQSFKEMINKMATNHFFNMKQLISPSSTQAIPKLFANGGLTKKKHNKSFTQLKKFDVDANPVEGIEKYESLEKKISEIASSIELVTFHTHFAFPEQFSETDKFKSEILTLVKQMTMQVNSRKKQIQASLKV